MITVYSKNNPTPNNGWNTAICWNHMSFNDQHWFQGKYILLNQLLVAVSHCPGGRCYSHIYKRTILLQTPVRTILIVIYENTAIKSQSHTLLHIVPRKKIIHKIKGVFVNKSNVKKQSRYSDSWKRQWVSFPYISFINIRLHNDSIFVLQLHRENISLILQYRSLIMSLLCVRVKSYTHGHKGQFQFCCKACW